MISQRENLGKYAFCVALAVLFALWQTSYWSLNQLKKNVESEFYTDEIIENLSYLLSSLKNMEEEYDEHAISQNEYSLNNYTRSKENVLNILKVLKNITADHPVYQKQLGAIELFVVKTFADRQREQRAEVIYKIVNDMKEQEKRSSKQHRDTIVTTVKLSFITMGIGIALVFVAVILVIFKMKNDLVRRRQTEKDLQQSKEQAEEAYKEIENVNNELKATYKKLMETSHHAGMAEVATDILHNVGNVLNSINVSATLISEKIENSEVVNLKKITGMIEKHSDNLAQFFADDPKGKHIPNYLVEAGRQMVEEQADILKKFRSLNKNIDHIKEIVKMQQSYGKVAGVEVSALLDEVIEDAIQINQAGLERNDIRIVRKYADLGIVRIDRQKVLQVLVNLIGNAKYAITGNESEEKLLIIQSYKYGEDRIGIDVIDNGVGISKAHLKGIFTHGFTTKKHGHGFGLHSGALAAKEMGGSLTVSSNGEGKGAIFTLELPFKSAKESQCAV